jgi:hypothetical protein
LCHLARHAAKGHMTAHEVCLLQISGPGVTPSLAAFTRRLSHIFFPMDYHEQRP